MKTDCLKKYFTALPALVLVCVFLLSGCTNVQTTLTASNSPTPSPSPSLSSETPTQETVIPPRESVIKKAYESPEFVFKYGQLIDPPEGLFSLSRDDLVFLYLDEFKSSEGLQTHRQYVEATSIEDLVRKLIYLDFSDEEIETMNKYMIDDAYSNTIRCVLVPDPYLLLDFELSTPETWRKGNVLLWYSGCEMYFANSDLAFRLNFHRPKRPAEDLPMDGTRVFTDSSIEKLKDSWKAETAVEVEYHGMPATEFQCKDKKIYYQKYTVDGQTYCIIVDEDADGNILDAEWGTTWKGCEIYIEREKATPELLEDFYSLRVGSKSE